MCNGTTRYQHLHLQGDESLGMFIVIDGSVSVHRMPQKQTRHHHNHHNQPQQQQSSIDVHKTPLDLYPRQSGDDHEASAQHEQGFVQYVNFVCFAADLSL
jgi:hypothetical protein